MTPDTSQPLQRIHRFLDEAGDTTFFGKGGVPVIGQPGVSLSFALGMARFGESLHDLRAEVLQLQQDIETDGYLNRIPSVVKRVRDGGFFFHAKDDSPEVRERMFRWIRDTDCSLEMMVGRKIPALFARKHNGHEAEFYADLLSHLLKDTPKMDRRLVITVAARGKTTRNQTLELALAKARERYGKKPDASEIGSEVVFNVQSPQTEPLLCVADYLAWSVQRVFEKGETRHYDFVKERISLVVDLYDQRNDQDAPAQQSAHG